MSSQITNYQCPACTGPLHFDSASGKLVCDYCGSSYTTQEIEEFYREKDEHAAEAFEKEEAAAAEKEEAAAEETAEQEAVDESPQGNPWDASDISSDWGKEAEGMKSYSCPSCGAELICEETTAASSCPYCGNPTIIPGQFKGALKPDYIIPFRLDQKAAEEALKRHYKGKMLLPGAFTKNNHIKEVKGIYVPFWLFDGVAEGEVTFHATRSKTYRRGDTEITETDHFNVVRGGSLAFSRVPADAKKNMPDGHMDAIEPFRYEEIQEFSTAYLPGYFADRYDVSAKQNIPRIERRVKETMVQQLEDTVSGYQTVKPVRKNISIQRGRVSYALLPVWILNTRWNGKNYLFAMNGQTGKIVGDLPTSIAKLLGWFIGLTAGIAAVLSVFLL